MNNVGSSWLTSLERDKPQVHLCKQRLIISQTIVAITTRLLEVATIVLRKPEAVVQFRLNLAGLI